MSFKFLIKKITVFAVTFIMFACLVASFGIGANYAEAKNKPITHVKIRLHWLHQAQFAGIYSAQEEGFFAEEGLDVEILPGGPGLNSVRMVASGSEQFGVSAATDIILARSEGVPIRALKIVVVQNPTCYFSRVDSGIKNVKDFRGKTIGITPGFETEYYLSAMLKQAGVSVDEVVETPVQAWNLTPFLERKVDVWPAYRINEPNVARSKGVEVTEIYPSDYGVNVSGDTLFTSDKIIKNNPQMVKKVVKAVMRGWKFAYDNREKAISYTMKYNTEGDINHEKLMLNSIMPLIFNEDGSFIQYNSNKRWSEMGAGPQRLDNLMGVDKL